MGQITITRALAELKTLNARINKAIQDSSLIEVTTGKKVVTGFKTNEDYIQKAKSTYQSIIDLIKYRDTIKSLIVKSNAIETVTIGGVTYTVAEAIEHKNGIVNKVNLLNKLKMEFNTAVRKHDAEVSKVSARLDDMLQKSYSTDTKVTQEQYDSIAKPFLEQNEPKLVDPLGLRNLIEKLEIEIDEFNLNVDFTLSESNSLKSIIIPD
jgi:mannose/fructose/N-acetylgalactosamine-specific phosphotransferase system component IIB